MKDVNNSDLKDTGIASLKFTLRNDRSHSAVDLFSCLFTEDYGVVPGSIFNRSTKFVWLMHGLSLLLFNLFTDFHDICLQKRDKYVFNVQPISYW